MAGREFPRLKKKLLVEFEDAAGMRQTAYTRDFSATGLYVLSESRPAPDDPQVVKVHLPRGVATLEGHVVRQGRGAPRTAAARPDGFAFALSAACDAFSHYVGLMERMIPELSRESVARAK